MTIDDHARAAVDAVTGWFAGIYRDVEDLNHEAAAMLEGFSPAGTDVAQLARTGRSVFHARVQRFLQEHPRVNGAGMIFSRSALGDGKGVTAWWVRDGADGVTRYDFGIDPSSPRFYDYEKLEWFTVSFETGQPWLTGPYIDYLGVEEYVVTITARSEVHGEPVGVTGLDMTVDDLERELLPLLRRARRPAALLNAHGAVLVSSTSRFSAGDILMETPSEFMAIEMPIADLGLTLVVRDEV